MSLTIEFPFVLPERVHLRLANPDGYTVTRIMRTDANGTRTVRTLSGLLPSAAAVIDVDDFEFSLSGPVTYTVYSDNTVRATAIAPGTDAFPGTVVLAVPLYPSDGITIAAGAADPAPSFVLNVNADRAARTTVHDVIGRPDPVAVLRQARLQSGDLDLVVIDLATARRIEAALALPRVFMLRQSDLPGLDLYFVVTGQIRSNISPLKRWSTSVGFAEVSWPNGAYLPVTVWTYADLAAGYADYNEVASSFVDYLAVLEHNPTTP